MLSPFKEYLNGVLIFDRNDLRSIRELLSGEQIFRYFNHSNIIDKVLMGIALENLINYPVLISASLGAMIGLERELAGKDPSLRTFSLICMGSCIFTLLSHDPEVIHISGISTASDPTRIAAQVVVGIGFIGAGTIFRSNQGVTGLTTAALMWVTAAIGMAVGYHRESLAFSATITAIFIAFAFRWIRNLLSRIQPKSKRRHGNAAAKLDGEA